MTAAQITLTLPADTRFVATARATTASIAAELEYGVDQIEDLLVGVNELVALLVEWAEDHEVSAVELVFRASSDAVEIEADARRERDVASANGNVLDDLTEQILDRVVDDHQIGAGWGRIVKLRT